MISEIILPALGETMDEATILRWLKAPGDTVEKGDPLFEIETDKATIEVEATEAGVLRAQRAEAGEAIPVGQVVGYLAEDMEAPIPKEQDRPREPEAERAAQPTPATATAVSPDELDTDRSDRVFSSPRARRLAREEGIEVEEVGAGTGPMGRIVEADVARYLERRDAEPRERVPELPPKQVVTLEGSRKAIAERMSRSVREAPQFTLTAKVDMSSAEEARERLNELALQEGQGRVTTTALLVAASAWALGRHPYVNATLHGEEIHLRSEIHIGVAVAREEGLIVPVLRDADSKSVSQIARELGELVERAQRGTLAASQASGSTFTVSNLGMFGIEQFTAIINPPESAILAVGGIERVVVPTEAGDIEVRPTLRMTLTCDHRVMDGAIGARFLADVKSALENPVQMLV